MTTLATGQLILLLVASAAASGCVEGEKKSVVGVCRNYSECHNGSWVIQQCSPSQSFDSSSSTCRFSWDVKCVDAPGDCSKPGLRLPVPNDCSSFFQCGADGNFQLRSCGYIMRYDERTSSCQFYTTVKCNKTPSCSGSVKVPVDDKCQYFRNCDSGQWVVQSCGSGMALDVNSNTCIKRTGSENCSSLVQCRDTVKLPIPGDCTSYSECKNGHWKIISCSPLWHFDFTQNTCVLAGYSPCKPVKCSPGAKLPVFRDCSTFWECENSVWKVTTCPDPGQLFDQTTLECVDAEKAACAMGPTTIPTTEPTTPTTSPTTPTTSPTTSPTTPTTSPTTPTTSKTTPTTSPTTPTTSPTTPTTSPTTPTTSTTTPTTSPTTPTTSSTTTKPEPCQNGALRGMPTNCKHYMECDSGKWTEKSCPTGYFHDDSFDCPSKTCKYVGATCCK